MTGLIYAYCTALVHNRAPKSTFFRCSWCLSVLNKIVLTRFVSSNQLYAPRRSFPESFKKFSFLFFTLLMASTWPYMARITILHVFWSFFQCSWCLSVVKKILLTTFVSSNQLYALRRSFPEIFK